MDDFIHKELIHFSNDDNIRSIPHLMDGLKPSQRKVFVYIEPSRRENQNHGNIVFSTLKQRYAKRNSKPLIN